MKRSTRQSSAQFTSFNWILLKINSESHETILAKERGGRLGPESTLHCTANTYTFIVTDDNIDLVGAGSLQMGGRVRFLRHTRSSVSTNIHYTQMCYSLVATSQHFLFKERYREIVKDKLQINELNTGVAKERSRSQEHY